MSRDVQYEVKYARDRISSTCESGSHCILFFFRGRLERSHLYPHCVPFPLKASSSSFRFSWHHAGELLGWSEKAVEVSFFLNITLLQRSSISFQTHIGPGALDVTTST